MSEQQKFEIIKSLAYGETPEQASEANGISVPEIQAIQQSCAAEIAEEREILKKGGYISDGSLKPLLSKLKAGTKESWIDVSAHQSVIDWTKVAVSGVKGAVIRAGYGDSLTQQDTYFAANIAGAIAAGLKTAVYWFSYADSAADAQKEWSVCEQAIGNYKEQIKFVAFDYEYDSYNYYKEIHGTAPAQALINAMANTFLNAAKADGYGAAIYTNNDYRKNIFTAETLAAWQIWLADYSGDPDIECFMQQTGSTGSVSGISGNVDTDTLFTVSPQTAVEIDTTIGVTKPQGAFYTFKTTCNQQPVVTVGTPGVVTLLHCRREIEADYWHLCFIGKSGSAAGIYTAAPGEEPLKRFVARVK